MRAAEAQQVTQNDVDTFVEGLPTSEFFGQNLSADQAVSALEYIFGDIINVVSGAPAAGYQRPVGAVNFQGCGRQHSQGSPMSVTASLFKIFNNMFKVHCIVQYIEHTFPD